MLLFLTFFPHLRLLSFTRQRGTLLDGNGSLRLGVSPGWRARERGGVLVGGAGTVPEYRSDLWLSGNEGGTRSRVNTLIGASRGGSEEEEEGREK